MIRPKRWWLIGTACAMFCGVGYLHEVSAAEPAKKMAVPRAADGHPDLQGTWTNGTATPFERPAELASQAVLTPEQARTFEQRLEDFRTHRSFKANEVGHDNEEYIDVGYKVLPTMQTSLVTDPSSGLVAIKAEAERRRNFNLSNYDGFESMSPWDRCITRGPTLLLPANYNNGYQIVQTRHHVVIVAEMIHEARVIPTDGSAHADARVTSWNGDSRGHWEGNTLVVDTTNFNDRGWLITHNGAGRLRGIPHSRALHIVERFTRANAETLNYEIMIDDPLMFDAPWKVTLPFHRDDTYRIFEYACHEGNTAVEMMMGAARAQERVKP